VHGIGSLKKNARNGEFQKMHGMECFFNARNGMFQKMHGIESFKKLRILDSIQGKY